MVVPRDYDRTGQERRGGGVRGGERGRSGFRGYVRGCVSVSRGGGTTVETRGVSEGVLEGVSVCHKVCHRA